MHSKSVVTATTALSPDEVWWTLSVRLRAKEEKQKRHCLGKKQKHVIILFWLVVMCTNWNQPLSADSTGL